MSARYLTEPEAWREISRRIVEGEWARYGLCHEACLLRFSSSISGKTLTTMEHLDDAPWVYPPPYAYPPSKEPEARALVALWLALEAEEEGA